MPRGRPSAPKHISNNVLPVQELIAVDFTPADLYVLMNNKLQWLQWLATHRLVRNSVNCSACGNLMSLISRLACSDGYSWRCYKCKCHTSVRTGSFFAHCELPTEKIVMIMYYWLCEMKLENVMRFEKLTSCVTIITYNNSFRLECYNWLLLNNPQLGGFDANGQSLVIEVDENYFQKKHRRSQFHRGQWVVGLVERGSGRCWLEVVSMRDAPTLERIICNHVLPGTKIITDSWRGYKNVGQLSHGTYDHAVIAQANNKNSVDPVHYDIHTQTIKGLWMHVKRKLRYHGSTNRGLFQTNLAEFMWRSSHKQNVFGQYLQLLCQNFNI